MKKLNLPEAPLKIKKDNDKYFVFDPIRRKYVALTPEEWVRQHIVHYLTARKHYPAGLTSIEHQVEINRLKQRADIVIFSTSGKPILIVECKAPSVPITPEVFAQAMRYNTTLGVRIVVVSNGLTHLAALLHKGNSYSMLADIPDYTELDNLPGNNN